MDYYYGFEEYLEHCNENPWSHLREEARIEYQKVLVVDLTKTERSMEFEQERRERTYQY